MLDPRPVFRPDAQSLRSGPVWSLGVVLAVIAAVWIAAASQWIFTDTVVPWDAKNQSYAFFRFLASSLHAGSSPFWNPYHYGGHPSVADPQSLIFSPAFLAWAWFDAAPSMRAFDLIVYAHLLVGGLAVGTMGWRMGWPLPASLLAAGVFMLGGPASGRLQHTGMILSYALFPLAMLLLSLTLQRRSMLIAVAFAVVAALLTLERNQPSLLLCFVLAAVLIGEIVSAADRWRWLREHAAVLATAAVVAALLLAGPLLLTMQFASLSNRPHVALGSALEASLYPANLATMAVANIMGSLEAEAYWGPNFDTLPDVGSTDQSFNYLFVGATTTIVLAWFGVAGGGLIRRGRRLLTGVLVVALCYMLGRYTPLYGVAFAYVPGISLFRRPVDGTFVFGAVLAVLVGHLLADYVREGLPRSAVFRVAWVAAGALALIAWAVMFSARSHHAWDSFLQVLKALPITLATIGVLWWAAKSARARIAAATCVAMLAAVELVWCNAASSLNAEPPAYYAALERPVGAEAAALAVLEREIKARHAQGERPRVEIVGVGGAWQNLAMTRGLEATNGYNPLRIGWYDRLVSPGEATYVVDQRLFPGSFEGYDCALARELGLEYVVLGRPIEQVPHLARRPVSDILLAGPEIWIYRLTDPEPRVRLVSRVTVANVDAEVSAGQFRVNPTAETVVIDDDTAPSRGYWPLLPSREGDYAQVVSWRPDRVEIEVDSTQSGVLVLHEAFYPGWLVEVDGRPARLLRANVLFRGVEVSEGRHNVVFRFAPFALSNLRDAALGLLRLLH